MSDKASRTASSVADVRLGPLTTIFTPEAACLRDLQLAPSATASPLTLSLGNPKASCYPSPYHAVYSPGRCPIGYATVTRAPSTDALAYQVPLAVDESAYVCCPSAFSYSNGSGGFCFQFVSQTTAPVMVQQAAAGIFNATPLPGTTSTYIGAMTITANAVVIRYRSSDFSALNITPATTGAAPNDSSSSSTGGAGLSSPSGMSQNKKLAIGLGVSLPLIALIIGVIAFLMRHRRIQEAVRAEGRPKSKSFVPAVSTSTVNVSQRMMPGTPPPDIPGNRGLAI